MTEASTAVHAGKETLHESLAVIGEYILPIAGGAAGFFLAGALGGNNLIYQALGTANITAGTATRIGGAVLALLWGSVGYCFWHLRSRGGAILKAVGGTVGGFFFGASLRQAAVAITGQGQIGTGLLDNLSDAFQNIAKGG